MPVDNADLETMRKAEEFYDAARAHFKRHLVGLAHHAVPINVILHLADAAGDVAIAAAMLAKVATVTGMSPWSKTEEKKETIQ